MADIFDKKPDRALCHPFDLKTPSPKYLSVSLFMLPVFGFDFIVKTSRTRLTLPSPAESSSSL